MGRPPNAPSGPDSPLFGDARSPDSRATAAEGAAASPRDVPPMFGRHATPAPTAQPAPPAQPGAPVHAAPPAVRTSPSPVVLPPHLRPRGADRRSELARAAVVFSGCTLVAAVIAAVGLVLQRSGGPHVVAPPPPAPAPITTAHPMMPPAQAVAPSLAPPRDNAGAAQPSSVPPPQGTPATTAGSGSTPTTDADAALAAGSPDRTALAGTDAGTAATPTNDETATGAPPPSTPPAVADPNAPPLRGHPSAREVRTATAAIAGRIDACVAQHGREGRHARLAVTYEGATGRVTEVRFYGHHFDGRPIAPCIEQAVREVPMPRFTDHDWSWDYAFRVR